MGKLRFVALCLALVACGSDDRNGPADAAIDAKVWNDAKVFMDAPPGPTFDFSCMGNAAPTTANATITLAGTVQELDFNGQIAVNPVDGATLKACVAGAANCQATNLKGTATSAADGSFSIGPIATLSAPQDLYIEMTKANTRTVYDYPAAPFTADPPTVPVLTFTDAALQALSIVGCNQSAGNGMIALAVTDCADAPITDSNNIMISVKQNNTEVSGTSVVDLGALNAQAAGTFLVCDVTPGATTTVGAMYNGKALRAHDVKVVAATTTATILRPGY